MRVFIDAEILGASVDSYAKSVMYPPALYGVSKTAMCAMETGSDTAEPQVFVSENDGHGAVSGLADAIGKIREPVLFVGWYIDQYVWPAVISEAVCAGIGSFPKELYRGMTDKWTKPLSASMERAFLQGWYPPQSGVGFHLCLQNAMELCGLDGSKLESGDISDRIKAEVELWKHLGKTRLI